MRYASILSGIALLSAPVAATQLTLSSARDADALEQCIASALAPIAPPSTIRGPAVRSLYFGTAGALVRIEESAPLRIIVRSGVAKRWRNRVANCAEGRR